MGYRGYMLRLRAVIRLLSSYIPQRLPQTGAAFEAWLKEVIALAGVPDSDSYRQAISTAVMQLQDLKNNQSKQYFVKVIQKRISAQLAYNVIDSIREKEKAQREQSLQNQSVS